MPPKPPPPAVLAAIQDPEFVRKAALLRSSIEGLKDLHANLRRPQADARTIGSKIVKTRRVARACWGDCVAMVRSALCTSAEERLFEGSEADLSLADMANRFGLDPKTGELLPCACPCCVDRAELEKERLPSCLVVASDQNPDGG
jgi:hypothetical protein